MTSRVARRHFLKLLSLGVAGLNLDVDRLLWIPGQKKIFIPSSPVKTGVSYQQILDIELQRIIPHLRIMFERDDTFYSQITKKE